MAETINQNQYFNTWDLGISSALISAGYKLYKLDRTNPRKILFSFLREGGLNEVIEKYWSDRLQVNARTYFDSIKLIKNRIYSDNNSVQGGDAYD